MTKIYWIKNYISNLNEETKAYITFYLQWVIVMFSMR